MADLFELRGSVTCLKRLRFAALAYAGPVYKTKMFAARIDLLSFVVCFPISNKKDEHL